MAEKTRLEKRSPGWVAHVRLHGPPVSLSSSFLFLLYIYIHTQKPHHSVPSQSSLKGKTWRIPFSLR